MTWNDSTIGDVLSIIKNGINCEQSKNQIGEKITRIETIAHKRFDFTRVGYANLTENEKEKSKLKIGDILFSHINSPIHVGKTAIYESEEDIYHGINLLLMRTIESVDPYYFNLFLNNLFLSGYWKDNCKKSVNQASVNQKDISKVNFSYPKIEIQRKIVVKVNAIFSEIDKAKEALEVSVRNVEALFYSYFHTINSKNNTNWKKSTIGDICNLMTGGTPTSTNELYYENGDIPWLVSGDINLNEIHDCEGRITELGYKNSNTKYLPVNSVMIALNGQGKTRGTVAMLRMKATCNQSLVSIFPKDMSEIIPDLIYYILKTRYLEIRKLTGDSGNDRRGLNMILIRKIEISYPKNLSEQEKLVNDLRALLNKSEVMKSNYLEKIKQLEFLKNSILKKAVNGELVKV